MRLFAACCCALLISCTSSTNISLETGAEGNWLIVYADHSLLDAAQAEKYQPLQDSIVDLYGLKLVQLLPGGVFLEMDSMFATPGRWNVFQNEKLLIAEAGKGFELFVGDFHSLKNDKLKVIQKVIVEKDTLPLTWAWKKIPADDPASVLFETSTNEWRHKSLAPETDVALKKRLASMLNYYSVYFDYIAKEAIYFLPRRLALPFNYYAHSVGLKRVDKIDRFKKYFYSDADALKAYQLLKTAQANLPEKFPEKDDFVKEYAAHFLQLKNVLEQP